MFRPDHRQPEQFGEAFYIVFRGSELVTDMRAVEPCILPGDQVRFLGSPPVRQQFMGFWHDKPWFARELPEEDVLDNTQYRVGNLYSILGQIHIRRFEGAEALRWL